ncbi:hypothetical protein E4T52_04759 [Aureobasidium sp. EXF-3400]|nr:hypothetical protein E4T51_03827 [Aureobasidium sp. EXF-12344]KAI4780347.1 hypothetical protein E4T52_04759 [Aureobasidium sp. EXF-3400]
MGVIQSSPVYEQVDIDEDLDRDNNKKQRQALGKLRMSIIPILVVILCLAAGWMAAYPRCKNLHVCREWRSLSTPEKDHYIQAVRCLLSKSSITRPNGVLYDDYPYTHARVGGYSPKDIAGLLVQAHNAAPFLPWHRYFLHIYETNLRTYCDYKGTLP